MEKKNTRHEKLYNIVDKIKGGRKYHQTLVVELKGCDLTYSYFQEHGFENSILIRDKAGLGMRVPSQNFTMNDIKKCIGSKKIVQVSTSKGEKKGMTMKEFTRLVETKRGDLNDLNDLNELSALERFDFSETKLETYVEQPQVVYQLDWANFLSSRDWRDGSNPEGWTSDLRVKKFCSMTLTGHFDHFSPSLSSQWLHILHGRIILWLMNPSEDNYQLYLEWKRSGEQTFLGDAQVTCQRLKVEHGWTLFIPSGWIVAQYTTEDALVIGGSFLNSFSMTNQIRAYKIMRELSIEDADTMHFKRKLWYVLDSYISVILGHSRFNQSHDQDLGQVIERHEKVTSSSNEDTDVEENTMAGSEDARPKGPGFSSMKQTDASHSSSSSSPSSGEPPKTSSSPPSSSSIASGVIKVVTVKLENCLLTHKQNKNENKVYLTSHEYEGMKNVLEFLLVEGFSDLPSCVTHPEDIINDVKKILQDCHDIQVKSSVTGKPIMSFSHREDPSLRPSKMVTSDITDQNVKIKSSSQVNDITPSSSSSLMNDIGPSSSSSTHGNQSGATYNIEPGTHPGHLDGWTNSGRESVLRRRRVRCKKCEPCTRGECGECHFCRDMKKFGGQGKMKQTCISRQCLAPILSTSAVCSLCGKGDHPSTTTNIFHQNPTSADGLPPEEFTSYIDQGVDLSIKATHKTLEPPKNGPNASNDLMECSICWKITHPLCFKTRHPELNCVESVTNEDLPNSWDCPLCCEAGKSGQRKPRPSKFPTILPTSLSFANPSMSSSSKKKEFTSESEEDDEDDDDDDDETLISSAVLLVGNSSKDKTPKKMKMESIEIRKRSWNEVIRGGGDDKKIKMTSPEDRDIASSSSSLPLQNITKCLPSSSSSITSSTIPYMTSIQNETKHANPTYPLGPHAPQFVVRPILANPPPKFLPLGGDGSSTHPLRMEQWLWVFRFLGVHELSKCMLVCKTWNSWCYYTHLWRRMDVSRRKIKKVHLIALAKRQPEILDMSYSSVNREQLSWLSERLFRLRQLKLEGCSWMAITSFCFSSSCPVLTHLDLSWVSCFNDSCLKALLSSSTDSRPGVTSTGCRLQNCIELKLSGTEVGIASIELISKTLIKLQVLDLSYCVDIAYKTLEFLTNAVSSNQHTPNKQPQQFVANKQHQLKQSPITVQGVSSSSQPLVGVHPHSSQSVSSLSPSPAGCNNQDVGANFIGTNINNANMTTNSSLSLPLYHDLMMPLPHLKKLFLIGCSWIDGAILSETRNTRPQLEIITPLEADR